MPMALQQGSELPCFKLTPSLKGLFKVFQRIKQVTYHFSPLHSHPSSHLARSSCFLYWCDSTFVNFSLPWVSHFLGLDQWRSKTHQVQLTRILQGAFFCLPSSTFLKLMLARLSSVSLSYCLSERTNSTSALLGSRGTRLGSWLPGFRSSGPSGAPSHSASRALYSSGWVQITYTHKYRLYISSKSGLWPFQENEGKVFSFWQW